MSAIPEALTAIAARVQAGEDVSKTLRSLLAMFGQARRGSVVNLTIANALAALNLRTEPDFRSAYIDDELRFVSATSPIEEIEKQPDTETQEKVYVGQDVRRDGSSYRVRRFLTEEKKQRSLTSIAPDATLQEATTLMLMHDYSQLPVMTNPRSLKGVVSWKSIGSAYSLGEAPTFVRDCMVPTESIVHEDDSIFKLIEYVTRYEVALVRAQDHTFATLFTAADLGDLYQDLSEAFIYLGEIEDCIRGLLERGQFTSTELAEFRGPDDADDVRRMDDLTFGSYLRIIEHPEHWERLTLNVDRVMFVNELDEIRIIRNAVMHFDPDGLTPEQIEQLRRFWAFLRRLRRPQ